MNHRNAWEISDMEWRSERAQAETVACSQPGCTAGVGETCTNLVSGVALEKLPAHAVRIRDAREGTQQ